MSHLSCTHLDSLKIFFKEMFREMHSKYLDPLNDMNETEIMYTVVTSKHDLTIKETQKHGNELTGYFQKYSSSSYNEINLFLKY